MKYNDNIPDGQHPTAEATVESNVRREPLHPCENNINRRNLLNAEN